MIKRISIIVVSLLTLLLVLTYGILRASLPSLDQHINAPVSANLALQRDALGRVIINASNRADAAFAMGYAHAQDRLFQMDLLRRSGAGEISELFGKAALDMDKRARFHRFRQRAQNIFAELPDHHKTLLERYSQGVNQAVESTSVLPFEYLFLQASFRPWLPEDSLLTSFSMYMDLQHSQVLRDLTFTRIREKFGQPMVDLLLMPSNYQAALDGSELRPY
jgi:penicillin amidase